MSEFLNFLKFFVEFPVLMYKRYNEPLLSARILAVLAAVIFTIGCLLLSLGNFIEIGIALILLSLIFMLLSYVQYKNIRMITLTKTPPVLNPAHDYAKPTSIINSLRDDDMNTLMFGRARQRRDALSENSEGGEIIKGHEDTSNLGEQYGSFTGASFYGGPEMYGEDLLGRVFPNIDQNFKTSTDKTLVLTNSDFENKRANLLATQNELNGTPNNTELIVTDEVREQLEPYKEQIFMDILERKNKEKDIPKEELLDIEDFNRGVE